MVRKLFITPPDAGTGTITRCVRVPASQEWLAVFNRAFLQLTSEWEWEQLHETDLTPAEAAEIAYNVYVDWLTGDCSLNCNDVLACNVQYTQDQLAAGTYNVNVIDPSDDTVIETRFPTAARETEILPAPAGCDLDEIWAGIVEIAQRIDDNGRDFWQTVVTETDKIDRIAEIIALVPLFGDIVGEALSILADIAPDMLDLYESYSTQSAIEGIACDLFQTVCGDCRYPTYQEVFDYYAGRSALGEAQWQNIAFDALVDILLGTSGASSGIVYMTTNILQIWVLSAAAQFVKTFGVKFLAVWAGVGASVPSDAWEILCGACGQTWSHDWLDGDGEGPFTLMPATFPNYCVATYNATQDRYEACLPANNSSRYIRAKATFAQPVNLTRISYDWAWKNTRSTAVSLVEAPIATVLEREDHFGNTEGASTIEWAGNVDVEELQFYVGVGGTTPTDGGYGWITRIHIEGVGYDPFA